MSVNNLIKSVASLSILSIAVATPAFARGAGGHSGHSRCFDASWAEGLSLTEKLRQITINEATCQSWQDGWKEGVSWWESFLFNIWWVVESFFTSLLPFLIGVCICIAIVAATVCLGHTIIKRMKRLFKG